MASRRNKHGLSRYIPRAVKEEVRRQCNFGCIFDGNLVYHYDHFAPEFVDCKSHEPEGIALLCPVHHEKKKKRRLGNELIAEQRKRPFSQVSGFGHTTLDWVRGPLSVRIGSQEVVEVETVLRANGTRLLWIDRPRSACEPFQLSGDIYDRSGRRVIRIRQNELVASTDRWDIRHESNRLLIVDPDGQVVLDLVHEYPSCFRLDEFHMRFQGVMIEVISGMLTLSNGVRSDHVALESNSIRSAPIAIDIS